MAYIRKFKTASGKTGVQICRKERGIVVETIHVGSAGTEKELDKLLKKAREIIDRDKRALFDLSEFDK